MSAPRLIVNWLIGSSMRNVDTSIYSSEKLNRIKPDTIDLSDLPPIVRVKPPSPLSVNPPMAETPVFNPEKGERNSERSENRTEERTEFRSEPLPIKRRTKRYSFEFFDDQIVRLKRLKNRVEENGESVTLSDMVRQALDRYLADRSDDTS